MSELDDAIAQALDHGEDFALENVIARMRESWADLREEGKRPEAIGLVADADVLNRVEFRTTTMPPMRVTWLLGRVLHQFYDLDFEDESGDDE